MCFVEFTEDDQVMVAKHVHICASIKAKNMI